MKAADNKSMSDYRRVLSFVTPHWKRLALVLALGLVSTLLGLAQPYITKLLIDEALLGRDMSALVTVAALMVVVTVLGFALNILSSYRYTAASADILFDMRLEVFGHLQRLSPRFYARTRLGEIVSRINNDISEVQRVAADSVLSAINNSIFLAGSVAIMLLLNWRLFLVSVALVPVSVLALRRYRARLADRVRLVRERSAGIGSFLIENLMGMRVVTAMNSELREADRFREKNRDFVRALLSMQLTSFMAGALPGTLLTLSTALVFLYGGKLVIDGALTVGSLVAFMAYHMRLLSPVQNLMGLYTSIATARVSLSRVFEIMDAPVEVKENPQAAPLARVQGEIEFSGVRFSHDRESPVLDSVSFRIPAGSFCAIVGPSGVGKSTAADLLLRFYDPEAGAIRLDGRDLRDIRLADLRREVALVEQSPFLFNATVAENIRYGRMDASDEEVRGAARAASIDSFIRSLPGGYETEVGERGQTLSAGERQRIALARALLRNPSVIVLDEPTASLDPATEQKIAVELYSAAVDRTLVIISHRPSLARMADQVIVIQDGRVVEAGPPAEVFARALASDLLFPLEKAAGQP